MTKQEFFAVVRKGLKGIPDADIEERLAFYEEMIDDRMEEGASEEEAVSAIGSADEIVAQIIADIPIAKIAKEKISPKRRLKVWEIVLLALGSPIWLSLMVAAVAVLLSMYAVLWAVVVSLWAVFAALVGGAIGGVTAGIVFVCNGNSLSGVAMLGAGLFCAGLAIFCFFGCKAATQGAVILTQKIGLKVKKMLIRKEEV